MIQRIQTVLLLLAAICLAVAWFLPIGNITTPYFDYLYSSWSLSENCAEGAVICQTYFIGLLQVILCVLALSSIFLYKNRSLQSKLCLAGLLLNVILVVLIVWIYPDMVLSNLPAINGKPVVYNFVTILLSIIPMALFYFAYKFILKDEKRVKAADRLR